MPHSSYSGQVAALSRRRSPDDPQLLAARRDLAAHQIEQYISRVVAGAPALTDDQRARIGDLLLTRGHGGVIA